jgi:maleate cis-trans isomerase
MAFVPPPSYDFMPKRKLGILYPLAVIDNSPFEFYRMVKDVMLVGAGVGLQEFSASDVKRVFAYSEELTEAMMGREIDLIMQSGVPLPILIGLDAHDELVGRLAKQTGKPATSSVLGVVKAARHLGIKNIALANKWRPEMNKVLGDFFAREGVSVAGAATDVMGPERFQKMGIKESFDLGWELGRQALEKFPEADGLYIGGGAWMINSLVEPLEREFGKPVICNQNAMIWNTLHLVDFWKPIPGYGRLLAGT